MYRPFFLSILFLGFLSIHILNAQEVYFVAAVAAPADTAWIGKINLEDCSFEMIYENHEMWGWRDIAICPNGKMYGCGLGIDEIDLQNGTFKRLYPLPLGYDQDGLVCSCDNILYGAGVRRDFFSYNVNTGEFLDRGKLPAGVFPKGDLFFFQGKLYASGINLPVANIIEINIDHPEQSSVIYAPTKRVIYGFYLVQNPCEEPFFYTQWKNAPPNGDDLLERSVGIMNPYTFEESKHCSFYFRASDAFGWAYPGEGNCTDPPPCEIRLDLDEDDSAGRPPADFQDTAYCSPEWIFLTDEDTYVYSGKVWDSVVVQIISPDPSLAALNGVPLPGFQLTGLGTGRLLIENAGSDDAADLALQLRQLVLVPDPVKSGITYKIAFVGFASDLVSDTSFAYLTVADQEITAGSDTLLRFCREDILLDLHAFLPSDASPGGVWMGGNIPSDGMVFLSDLNNTVVQYITEDPQCGEDTAQWLFEIIEPPDVNLGEDTSICDGTILTLTLPASTIGTWQDGSTGNFFQVTNAGWYSVMVADSLGCSQTDSIYVDLLEEVWIDTILYLCPDEMLLFQGEWIDAAGKYMITVEGAGDCDTIWSLTVFDEDDYRGIVQSGDLCHDAQVSLRARNMQAGRYEWSTGAKGTQIQTSSGGWYQVTVMYGNHCQVTDSIYVMDCADPVYLIPNIFSPNGDGVNDNFFVTGKDFATISIAIYDRWGGLLFTSDESVSPVWNGKVKNKEAPSGVYAYKVRVILTDGRVFSSTGTVTLIR